MLRRGIGLFLLMVPVFVVGIVIAFYDEVSTRMEDPVVASSVESLITIESYLREINANSDLRKVSSFFTPEIRNVERLIYYDLQQARLGRIIWETYDADVYPVNDSYIVVVPKYQLQLTDGGQQSVMRHFGLGKDASGKWLISRLSVDPSEVVLEYLRLAEQDRWLDAFNTTFHPTLRTELVRDMDTQNSISLQKEFRDLRVRTISIQLDSAIVRVSYELYMVGRDGSLVQTPVLQDLFLHLSDDGNWYIYNLQSLPMTSSR